MNPNDNDGGRHTIVYEPVPGKKISFSSRDLRLTEWAVATMKEHLVCCGPGTARRRRCPRLFPEDNDEDFRPGPSNVPHPYECEKNSPNGEVLPVNPENMVSDEIVLPHACVKCGGSFKNRDELDQHTKTHSPEH